MTTHDRPFGRHLEDFVAGDVYKHWPGKTITEYDDHLFCMITMNHHPLHTNEWFAENETVQKQNVVVGNLVYSLVLGMSVPDVSGAAIANLEIESLLHAKPTFHGDTIYAVTKVLDVKETSKGDRGIVTVETKGINQRGEEVCYFRRKLMVWKREHAPHRPVPLRRHGVRRRVTPADAGGRCRSMTSPRVGSAPAPPPTRRARPGYPDEAIEVLAAEVGIGAGHRRVRPGRRHRQAHPPAARARRDGHGRRAGRRRCARRPQAAAPGATAPRRHRRGDPARPTQSVDVVTVAQAFHWFDAPAALAEIARVLRPGGRLAILWNERDESTAWVAEMSRIIRWHERTVSRYQHTDWAERRRRRRPVQPAARAGVPVGAAAHPRDARRPRPLDQLHRRDADGRARAARRRRCVALVARRAGAVPAAVPVPRAVVPASLSRPAGRRPRLVGGAAPRPAVAPDPRSLGGAGVRGDGPADAGRAGRASAGGRSSTGSRRRPRWPRAGRRGGALVVGARLQPARRSTCTGARARRSSRDHGGRLPADLDALLGAPRHRAVHGPGGAGLRLRGRPRRGRHEHGAGARALGGSPARAPGRRRRRPTRPSRRAGLGVEPGDARPRRDGVHARGRRAATACPVADALRVGGRRAIRTRIRPTARRGSAAGSPASRAATARAAAASSRRCARGPVADRRARRP